MLLRSIQEHPQDQHMNLIHLRSKEGLATLSWQQNLTMSYHPPHCSGVQSLKTPRLKVLWKAANAKGAFGEARKWHCVKLWRWDLCFHGNLRILKMSRRAAGVEYSRPQEEPIWAEVEEKEGWVYPSLLKPGRFHHGSRCWTWSCRVCCLHLLGFDFV